MLQEGIIDEAEFKTSQKSSKKLFPHGIPECGTDALRFTLCCVDVKQHTINFNVVDCQQNKFFFNKIWNATRYTLASHDSLGLDVMTAPHLIRTELEPMDRWIMSRLANVVVDIHQQMDNYDFHLVTKSLRTFFYTNLCDVYLETTKSGISAKNQPSAKNHCAVLVACLSIGLQHLSYFAPFVSHELNKHLPTVPFQPGEWLDEGLERDVDRLLELCLLIRQLKSQQNINKKKHEPESRFERKLMSF